ncbi:uncharacterized protein C20orf204 homolog [Ctenodactylus gundi]
MLSQARPHSCSIPDVLHHYRAVISEDLRTALRQVGPEARRTGPGSRHHHVIHKDQTGASGGQGQPEVSCSSQKEHGILLSIASLGQTLRGAVTGVRRGALEKAVWTLATRMEAVMRLHCQTPRQGASPSQRQQPRMRPIRRHSSRRRLLLHALDTVATCWEKLFALRASPRLSRETLLGEKVEDMCFLFFLAVR